MSRLAALFSLGWRLIRAGGPFRIAAIGIGGAIAALALLLAAAIPGAVQPPGAMVDAEANTLLISALALLLVPVIALLLTVGRVSAAVRDQRLASIRMLGLPLRPTRLVAAVENGTLALAGSVAGLLAYRLSAPVLSAWLTPSGLLARPLSLTPLAQLAPLAIVTAISVTVAVAPLGRLRHAVHRERSDAAVRRVSPWRLTLPALAAAALVFCAATPSQRISPDVYNALLMAGVLLSTLSIALAVPVVTRWLAGRMVRSRSVAATLAGRSIETEPAASSRLVAGIGVSVFVIVAAIAVLGAYQSTPQYRYQHQQLHAGPQLIQAQTAKESVPFTAQDIDTLTAVAGARGWLPVSGARLDSSGPSHVFVGTCEQLALAMTVTGCNDARAAVLADVETSDDVPGAPRPGERVKVTTDTGAGPGESVTVQLAETPIEVDVRATMDTWVYEPMDTVFVPSALAPKLVIPNRITLVADGGLDVPKAVASAAEARGLAAWTYPTSDYDSVTQMQAVIVVLAAATMTIGLVALALGAIDRTLGSRRTIARQRAIGIPAATLRRSLLAQTLTPLAVALAMAFVFSILALAAYVSLVRLPEMLSPQALIGYGVSVVAAVLLTALATLPAMGSRITPQTLRQE